MAIQEVVINTNPAGPVPYNEKAVLKTLGESYLIADTKKDGVQLNLVVRSGCHHFLSRAGKQFPALAYVSAASDRITGMEIQLNNLLLDDMCIYPDGFMLQAELVTPGFPAEVTAGNLRRKSKALDLEAIEVHVFGVVPMDVIESGEDHEVTHSVMKYHIDVMVALLQKHVPQIKWCAIESLDVFTLEEMNDVYQMRRSQGEEGVVLKDPNGIWKRGKKVGQWKMKPEDTIDGQVVGLVWGTPGLANEGKVIGFEVQLEDGHVVNACGLTQAQKDEFTEEVRNANLWCARGNPYQYWTVEVSFMERFQDGSLRHPTFNRWRGVSDPYVKE